MDVNTAEIVTVIQNLEELMEFAQMQKIEDESVIKISRNPGLRTVCGAN